VPRLRRVPIAGRIRHGGGPADGIAVRSRSPRYTGTVLACALLVAACGDALSGVGDLSRRVVYGDATTTSTSLVPSESQALRLKGITDMVWPNDGIDPTTAGMARDLLITTVWLRGDGINPFVQASRIEIATALPGIEFPQLAPEAVTHVSSQLLFDQLTGFLDASTAAAFGFWVGPPYELPRAEGQLSVLRVGLKTLADDTGGEIFSFQVSEGRELAWTDGDYVYQLFCRTGVSEAACFAIAESTIPLSLVAALP
jgi:hypothetical protein